MTVASLLCEDNMDQEYRGAHSYAVPRDADIAAIVSLVVTIAIVGLWRLIG